MKHQECRPVFKGEFDLQFQRAVKTLQNVRKFSIEDSEPCRVASGLYIGSIGAAKNLEALRREGVTHILNASPIVPCFYRHTFKYKLVGVYDDPQEDISQFFAETNKYIAKGRRRGGILIHCYAGMSRSATFVLAYLIACEGMTLSEALHTTQLARPKIRPNPGFMAQLLFFSQQISLERAVLKCTVLSLPPVLSAAASSGRLLEYKESKSSASACY